MVLSLRPEERSRRKLVGADEEDLDQKLFNSKLLPLHSLTALRSLCIASVSQSGIDALAQLSALRSLELEQVRLAWVNPQGADELLLQFTKLSQLTCFNCVDRGSYHGMRYVAEVSCEAVGCKGQTASVAVVHLEGPDPVAPVTNATCSCKPAQSRL